MMMMKMITHTTNIILMFFRLTWVSSKKISMEVYLLYWWLIKLQLTTEWMCFDSHTVNSSDSS